MTDERRRNIKMVYGSLAYDLDTLARERQLEEAGEMPQRTAQPERQPQPQTRRRPQAQAKARPSALTVGGIAAVCALVMVLLLGYVQLTAVSNNVSTIKKELATLEDEHVTRTARSKKPISCSLLWPFHKGVLLCRKISPPTARIPTGRTNPSAGPTGSSRPAPSC